MNFYQQIGSELGIAPAQAEAVARLLDEGATIPFIARYRKEAHGSLDEVAVTAVRDRLAKLRELEERRAVIMKSLEERELLTAELGARIATAGGLAELEDIYLPYRPKRRTRAMIAREKGLEPLALKILEQDPALRPAEAAAAYLDGEKGLESPAQALAGARDIIAELASEDAAARAQMRAYFARRAQVSSMLVRGKEEEGAKYRDYFAWQEPAARVAGHRLLAMLRGESEGFLSVRFQPEIQPAQERFRSLFVKNGSPAGLEVREAVDDAYKRLLAPSLENELRAELRFKAETEAIAVFARNLRELLLAPPLGQKRVLALDPGYRTGCKLVCLDAQGRLLHHDLLYVMTGAQLEEAARKLRRLCAEYAPEAIAIGNGTAGRETEALARSLRLSIPVLMVSESGASVYSASEAARREFPDLDLTVRGAVSIGRRLMDPLAELVKIDPKAIGVGQYQHDVDQTRLRQSLFEVVESCVNAVGVELNTASAELLAHVSGLGPALAKAVVAYREANGPFARRQDLLKVPRLGPKAFEQAAGFLRIRGGSNPLDASAVHPESYAVVEKMAKDQGCALAELLADPEKRARIRLEDYASEKVGLPTLKDIMAELEKPGRDPRQAFEVFSFAENVHGLEDLEPGMHLPGIVTNVTNFGAFVDVGAHQDGLVHISQMADSFVRDPHALLKVGQQVRVTVLEVDAARKRVALSLRNKPERPAGVPPADGGAGRSARPAQSSPAQSSPAQSSRDEFRPDEKNGLGAAGKSASGRGTGRAQAPAGAGKNRSGDEPFNDAFAKLRK